MRDSNERNQHNEKSNLEIFEEFRVQLNDLLSQYDRKLLYNLPQSIGIIYDGGFIEVYVYDRPRNPVIEEGCLKFTYSFLGKPQEIELKIL